MSIYYGAEKGSYAERKRARLEADAQKRKAEKAKPPVEQNSLDPLYYNGDGSRLSYAERAALRKAADEGRKESEREARAREEARLLAIPEWECRRDNNWRITLERRKALDRAGNRQSPQVLRDLKRRADEEDKIIDAEMAEKKRQHRIDTDPEIQKAVAYAEKHFAECPADQKTKWAEILAIAEEGDKALAWQKARELTEANLQKQMQLQADHDAKTLAGLAGRDAIRQQVQRIEDELASIPADEEDEKTE